MFTERYYKLLSFQFKISANFAGTPLLWNDKNESLYTTKSSIDKCLRNGIKSFIYMLWLGVRILQMKFGSISKESLPFTWALFMFFLFNLFGFLAILKQPQFCTSVFNAIINYSIDFQGESEFSFQAML